MGNRFKLLVSAAMAMVAFSQAQAGEKLYLQSGTIDPIKTTNNDQSLFASLGATQKLWILQFQNKITATELRTLRRLNVRVISYIPDDAYLVEVSPQTQDLTAHLSNLRSAIPFEARHKLSPNMPTPSTFNQNVAGLFHIRSTGAANLANLRSLLEGQQIQIVDQGPHKLKVQATMEQIASIAGNENVQWIEQATPMELMVYRPETASMQRAALTFGNVFAPRPKLTDAPAPIPNPSLDELNGFESGTKVMNMAAAWDKGYNGAGQITAAADTGLDTGDAATLPKDFSHFKEGQIFGIFAKNWGDPMGHGTHVLGSIGSTGQGTDKRVTGSAPEAQLIMQGMWSPVMENLTVPSDLKTLFQKAYASGARIHSNSWGSAASFGAYTTEAQEVDEFVWKNPDMLVLFAAGNSGEDKDRDGRVDEGSVSSPGTAKNILTVGASENLLDKGGIQKKMNELKKGKEAWPVEPLASDRFSDNANGVALFSSRGPTKDGRIKPEIVAPGTNILSNCSHHPGAEPLWGNWNKDYCFSGGTSMATPLTAGAATVAREYLIKKHSVQNPSGALVKNLMIHSAFDMFPGQFGEVGKDKGQELLTHRPDNHQGFGRVDMTRLMAMDQALIVDEAQGVAVNEEKSYEVKVSGGGSLTATLVYTDAPAAPNAAKSLVNDLDLSITLDGKSVFQSKDHVNNSEIAELTNLNPGVYKVSVKGVNIPQGKDGKQPFSLVVSAK